MECVCACVNSPLQLDLLLIEEGAHGSYEVHVLMLQGDDDWLRQHGGVHHLIGTDNHRRDDNAVYAHRWALGLHSIPLTVWEGWSHETNDTYADTDVRVRNYNISTAEHITMPTID